MARRITDHGEAAAILGSGGVLVLGTDTLPGLHCRADDPDAVARIFALKGRASDQPLLVLAGSEVQARTVCGSLSARQELALGHCWPGPFSVILPADPALPEVVTAGGPTVAVRVPRLEPLRRIIVASGHPLVSTSANVSGVTPDPDAGRAAAVFGDRIDGWWSAVETPSGPGLASGLIDLTAWPPRTLREGPEPWREEWADGLDADSPEE